MSKYSFDIVYITLYMYEIMFYNINACRIVVVAASHLREIMVMDVGFYHDTEL